ncbi:hypothetical protein COCMIDRAFT_38931 [Bipolaris oryzae ATCC 44560]|uniref:aldehyde dehydrogenase (NAD(+)) n=1 Tax=Bipolaris oryzae ATCC 44560 TaxID=930090 RepID=W6YZN8_COCMI|nr:uncharacterized protein COCMIDRAFT_38931 [Bipolaris oryzae ATCC 44560]EUC43080.1 hypothetical protein COCMIDRAFT_38931 [Bipolaris oryzae ATCC 44560]
MPQTIQLKAPNRKQWEQPTGLFLDHEFVDSSSPSNTISSIDPATEEEITVVQTVTAENYIDVTERGRLIAKLADLVEENKELLATTVDAWGNELCRASYTTTPSMRIFPKSVSVLRSCVGWADKIFGQAVNATRQKSAYTIRQSVGVIAQVIPWSYPLPMACWKIGPALACGNTVVLKAAEQTPLPTLILASLIEQARFPPGVVNILNGLGKEADTALVQHPLVDKVSFAGFTATSHTDQEGGLYSGSKSKKVSVISDQWSECLPSRPLLKVTRQQYERMLSYVDTDKSEGAQLRESGEARNSCGYFVKPTASSTKAAAQHAHLPRKKKNPHSDLLPLRGEAGLDAYSQVKAVHINMGTKL